MVHILSNTWENLKRFVISSPPWILFMLSLGIMAIGILFLAWKIGDTDRDTDHGLSNVRLCWSGEVEKGERDFVSFQKNVSLPVSFRAPLSFANFVNTSGTFWGSGQMYSGQLGLKGSEEKVSNWTFTLSLNSHDMTCEDTHCRQYVWHTCLLLASDNPPSLPNLMVTDDICDSNHSLWLQEWSKPNSVKAHFQNTLSNKRKNRVKSDVHFCESGTELGLKLDERHHFVVIPMVKGKNEKSVTYAESSEKLVDSESENDKSVTTREGIEEVEGQEGKEEEEEVERDQESEELVEAKRAVILQLEISSFVIPDTFAEYRNSKREDPHKLHLRVRKKFSVHNLCRKGHDKDEQEVCLNELLLSIRDIVDKAQQRKKKAPLSAEQHRQSAHTPPPTHHTVLLKQQEKEIPPQTPRQQRSEPVHMEECTQRPSNIAMRKDKGGRQFGHFQQRNRKHAEKGSVHSSKQKERANIQQITKAKYRKREDKKQKHAKSQYKKQKKYNQGHKKLKHRKKQH